MGFKDKVRNNQNAEHATIEDYRNSIQEKYLAERVNRGKPVAGVEVPAPVTVEPIKQPIKAEQFEEAPAFVKSHIVEPAKSELESEPEEKIAEESEEKKLELAEEKAVKPIDKHVKKNTKFKKKDPTNP